jgi:hypothetical protein
LSSSADTIPMVGDAAPAIIALPLAKSISASCRAQNGRG